ncbi:MAG: transposase [Desulfobacterales bacterium]|nr:transposase [Desulfobacterales bacterium]
MKYFPVRKKIRLPPAVYNQGHAFFITISTHQRHTWFQLYPQLCKTAVLLMRDVAVEFRMKIYAWCIMPDHLHLLLQGQGIVDFIHLFKGRLTPAARAAEPGRRLWQRSFYDHALRKEESLAGVAGYIWENPVRAQIVAEPGEYVWSGSEVWPNWREFYGRG